MYLDFFSFSEKPFNVTPDTRFLYLSPQHEEAIGTLLYGVRERKGFIILTGEVGTGKTTSIRAFLNRLGKEAESSLIINPLVSTVELLKGINHDFGQVSNGETVQGQIDTLNKFLLEGARTGRNAVVIIDEAQDLSPEALEMVRLLSNLETETHKLMQIVLVGQPELEQKLSENSLRQLRQRIQLRYALAPLNEKETERYICFRLEKAAPKCCLAFRPSAFRRIHEWTGGIPRMINTLCDLVLLAAYTRETHVITKKIVDLAYTDLSDKSWSRRPSFLQRVGMRGGH